MNCPDKFHYWSHYNLSSALVLFGVTPMHLFSKYRRQGSGTYFQNTGFLTASAKLAVKYWPGW